MKNESVLGSNLRNRRSKGWFENWNFHESKSLLKGLGTGKVDRHDPQIRWLREKWWWRLPGPEKRKMTHHNIEPSNVMIVANIEFPLVDFGIGNRGHLILRNSQIPCLKICLQLPNQRCWYFRSWLAFGSSRV